MIKQEVVSSNIKAIGYDPDTATLEVEFLNGGVYSYAGVPAAIFMCLMEADSHGAYFNKAVKKGGYPFTKLN